MQDEGVLVAVAAPHEGSAEGCRDGEGPRAFLFASVLELLVNCQQPGRLGV